MVSPSFIPAKLCAFELGKSTSSYLNYSDFDRLISPSVYINKQKSLNQRKKAFPVFEKRILAK